MAAHLEALSTLSDSQGRGLDDVVASYRQLAAATTERCEATGRLTAEQALHLREILGPEQPNRLEG